MYNTGKRSNTFRKALVKITFYNTGWFNIETAVKKTIHVHLQPGHAGLVAKYVAKDWAKRKFLENTSRDLLSSVTFRRVFLIVVTRLHESVVITRRSARAELASQQDLLPLIYSKGYTSFSWFRSGARIMSIILMI